jgi:mannose-1-phosphate guanylyltransferase
MVQRVYRQIREASIDADITVAASEAQRDSIISHLGDSANCVWEPERRDTFPAIALVSAYLYSEKKCSEDEIIVVMPVDPYTEPAYFRTINNMAKAVEAGADMALMGIEPTYNSSKYGYIVPKPRQATAPYGVERFIEKPTEETATELIKLGAKWNGGVFAFKLGHLISIIKDYVIPVSYLALYESYNSLPKISFDYEVVEKAKNIVMLPFSGLWRDLGTWNMLCKTVSEPTVGAAILGEGAENSYVINEMRVPIIALGVKDTIVAASPDGILVTTSEASAKLKLYVDELSDNPICGEAQRNMYEERRWGAYSVIDYRQYEDKKYSLTKHLYLRAGKTLSYQRHNRRDEIWTIVDGAGELLIDGHVRSVKRGDVAYITSGQKHAIKATTDLRLIEVQIGESLEEKDIERFDWQW